MAQKAAQQLTLVFAHKLFVLDGQARNLSPKTLAVYGEQLTWFEQYAVAADVTLLSDVEPALLKSYLIHLQQKGWQPASVHIAFRVLRTFFRFLHADGLVPDNLMVRVRAPKLPPKELPAFSEDEIRRLLAAAQSARDRALLLCLLDTGCRASELLGWNIGDVNIETGVVALRTTKGRKPRTVYLGLRSRKQLLRLLAEAPGDLDPDLPIWRNSVSGTRLTLNGLSQLLGRLGASAGVHPCNAHRFRRTFALMALRNGMNIYALQRLMGHATIDILRRYLPLVEADLQTAHARFGAVDHLERAA